MAKQVQRAIGWVAAFLLEVGMLFLPVSKAYAGPVSGGSPGSGEMRGVWVSYLDWNGWAKDEAGYKKAMDQTLDLCVQKGLNAVFLQVRPDGDAMYPSQYFPWSKFVSGKQGKNPGYDPLAYAVQAAHQRGLQLHAWINPYRICVRQILRSRGRRTGTVRMTGGYCARMVSIITIRRFRRCAS